MTILINSYLVFFNLYEFLQVPLRWYPSTTYFRVYSWADYRSYRNTTTRIVSWSCLPLFWIVEGKETITDASWDRDSCVILSETQWSRMVSRSECNISPCTLRFFDCVSLRSEWRLFNLDFMTLHQHHLLSSTCLGATRDAETSSAWQ